MQMIILPIIMVAVKVVVTAANETIPSRNATNTSTSTSSPYLRGRHHYPPHRYASHRDLLLKAHKSSNTGHTSTYQGCLGYSDSELSQSWSFSSEAPSCSWVHANGDSSGSSTTSSSNSSGGGGSSDGGSGSGGSGNGGSGSGSSSGSGSGNDNEESGEDYNDQVYDSSDGDGGDNDGYNGNTYDNGDANDGDSNGEDGSEYEGSTDDEVIVSNEDVYGGDTDYDPFDDFDIEVVSFISLVILIVRTGCPKESDISVITSLLLLPSLVRYICEFVDLGPRPHL